MFRQGDDAINWYALLEGSVDVKVVQKDSSGHKVSTNIRCLVCVCVSSGWADVLAD